jgi:hypothetical protein
MSKFQPGQSGNPSGRPKGIVDERSRVRIELQGHASELIALALDRARSGSDAVLVALLNRLLPPLRPEQVASDAQPISLSVRWVGLNEGPQED